jgi:hypothetical protein
MRKEKSSESARIVGILMDLREKEEIGRKWLRNWKIMD